MNRVYSLIADLPDFRDIAFADVVKVTEPAPLLVDLRTTHLLSPVKDQGQLGSCTANAGTSIVEFAQRKAGRTPEPLSRLMYYYLERAMEHTVHTDSGAQIRDGIKAMCKTGACPESIFPYAVDHFTKRPPARCYAAAAPNKISKYARLTGTDDMVNCLAAGFPFTFGFSVYQSFESNEVANTGRVPVPDRSEKLLGGHAVHAIGYDLPNRQFVVRNSWGTDWGQAGDCLMPFDYLANTNLCSDVWVVLP